jgi:hypothetical protein
MLVCKSHDEIQAIKFILQKNNWCKLNDSCDQEIHIVEKQLIPHIFAEEDKP